MYRPTPTPATPLSHEGLSQAPQGRKDREALVWSPGLPSLTSTHHPPAGCLSGPGQSSQLPLPAPGTPLLLSSEILSAPSLRLSAWWQAYHLFSVCPSNQTINVY